MLQVDGRPFAEVGLRYGLCSDILLDTAEPISLIAQVLMGKGENDDTQLSPPSKMLVVIEEIIAALAPGPRVYTGVLSGLRGRQLAYGPVERLRSMVFRSNGERFLRDERADDGL